MKKYATIMLIEDDAICQVLTKSQLLKQALAQQVITATNGQEGLDYLLANQASPVEKPWPELILLDLNMPVMDGFEFLAHFAELDLPNKPLVVILTSSIDARDMEKVRQFQVGGYLLKPFTPEKLLSIL